MNVYDSVKMAELMAPHGYAQTNDMADADLVVLNTCHIREKAAEKVYSEIGRVRQLRDRRQQLTGRDMTIVVAGCVAQAEGNLMSERAPDIDIVLGPQVYHRLPEMLAKHQRLRKTIVETDFPIESKFDHLPTSNGAPAAISSFLSIQEGCDKFCSFCVVPYTRGAEESRPINDLFAEACRLVARGAREITLLGQNVNAYHGKDANGHTGSLAVLIDALSEIDDLKRLRYTTSHPIDMDDALIARHGANRKMMPYLHLPAQSGSDAVLKAMHRGYTVDDYRRIVEKLRITCPDIALSSDFIVGFPGESDHDFEQTLRLAEDVQFAQSFSFKYSRRPGTPAAGMRKQLEERVKDERLSRLQSLLARQALCFNQASIGKVCQVLIERRGRHAGQVIGRTPHFQPIHFEAPESMLGTLAQVRIVDAGLNSLSGRLLNDVPAEPTREACA